MLLFAMIVAACGGGGTAVPPTLPPSATPTARPTLLPTVGTSVPLGSEQRPLQVVLIPPKDSSETGTSLKTFLASRTGLAWNVQLATSNAEVLAALCGATPTFGWVDGWTLLAADAQGCSVPLLRFKQGSGSDAATGIRSELVARTVNKITAIAGFKDRIFCRLNSQDAVSWILPSILMRAGGVSAQNFKSVLDYADTQTMLQALSDGVCVAAAIPAGSLSKYQVTDKATPTDISKAINSMGVTPELPYGGLMISTNVPQDIADTVTKLFLDHPDELKGLVSADALVKTSSADFAEIEKFLQAGGINLRSLGQ